MNTSPACRALANGLPRVARLRVPAQFKHVLSTGKAVHTQHLRLLLAPPDARALPAPGCARLGVTVGKRVDRRAVLRNRCKRLIRESFREYRARLAPLDYVVIAKPGAAAQVDLAQELHQLWRRALSLNAAYPAGTMSGRSLAPADAGRRCP